MLRAIKRSEGKSGPVRKVPLIPAFRDLFGRVSDDRILRAVADGRWNQLSPAAVSLWLPLMILRHHGERGDLAAMTRLSHREIVAGMKELMRAGLLNRNEYRFGMASEKWRRWGWLLGCFSREHS
jgi:hypothetical protein